MSASIDINLISKGIFHTIWSSLHVLVPSHYSGRLKQQQGFQMTLPASLKSGEVARLLPVTVDSNKEARAASILLASLSAVRPFREAMLDSIGLRSSHTNIGVSRFDRMNADWKDLVAKIQAGAVLPKIDASVEASVSSWHQEVRDLCLLMTRKLNAPVQAYISKPHRDDPELRMRDDCEHLVKNHKLYARLDIPDAAAPLEVVADLVRRSVCIYMSVTAPKDKKKTSARVGWLIKQLAKSNPENVYIRASWPGRAPITQALLKDLREDPALIEGGNKTLAPVAFEVMLVHDMAAKFSGAKTFIEQLEEAVPRFYKDVGQHLRAYVAAPPKLQPKVQVAEEGDDADVLDPPLESHIDDMDEQVSSAPSSSLILGVADHEA